MQKMNINIKVSLAVLSSALIFVNCAAEPPEGDKMTDQTFPPETIRQPAVAGTWYPGRAETLSAEIDKLLDRALDVDLPRDPVALIAPHAGYAYSGPTAAWSFRQVKDLHYESVIVLAPSHHEWFEGVSVWDRGAYKTPLGLIPVDVELAKKIEEFDPDVHYTPKGHGAEHSLEIELPFLQRTIPDLKIVPLVMADRSANTCRKLADAIHQAVGDRKVLIVASSDLYHGHNYHECLESDDATLECVEKLDADEFCRGVETGKYMACGGGPITVAIMAAKLMGATEARILKQTNSNDVMGQRGGYVVGYGAVAIY
jgi:AmmeMemoRadiSam system protein B